MEAVDPPAVAYRVGRLLDLTGIEQTRADHAFVVFRATSPRHGPVALRVPRRMVYRPPGELPVPAARLLGQEQLVCGLLARAGLPVPVPLRLLRATAGTPVLVTRFVDADGGCPDPAALGEALARLHATPVPDLDLVTHERCDAAPAISARLLRRWGRIRALVPDLPSLPSASLLAALLAPATASRRSLLHLDVRACNLMAFGGALRAIVGWSSAMLAHPACEVARLREYAVMPGNHLHLPALLGGYRRVAPIPRLDRRTETLLRLDAVSMLALLCRGDPSEPAPGPWAVSRLRELMSELPFRVEV